MFGGVGRDFLYGLTVGEGLWVLKKMAFYSHNGYTERSSGIFNTSRRG